MSPQGSNMGYDTYTNRRIAEILKERAYGSHQQPDHFVFRSNSRPMVLPGNAPYDEAARFDTVGGRKCGGINHLKKAHKWTGFVKSLVPPKIAEAAENVAVSQLKRYGGSRGDMIKKVMSEHGLTLPNASKFIKEHGLQLVKKHAPKIKELALHHAPKAMELALQHAPMMKGKGKHLKAAREWHGFVKSLVPPKIGNALENVAVSQLRRYGGRRTSHMPAPGMAGSTEGRVGGASAWVSHVKAYAAKHGCTYKQAMSLARSSYKK